MKTCVSCYWLKTCVSCDWLNEDLCIMWLTEWRLVYHVTSVFCLHMWQADVHSLGAITKPQQTRQNARNVTDPFCTETRLKMCGTIREDKARMSHNGFLLLWQRAYFLEKQMNTCHDTLQIQDVGWHALTSSTCTIFYLLQSTWTKYSPINLV